MSEWLVTDDNRMVQQTNWMTIFLMPFHCVAVRAWSYVLSVVQSGSKANSKLLSVFDLVERSKFNPKCTLCSVVCSLSFNVATGPLNLLKPETSKSHLSNYSRNVRA